MKLFIQEMCKLAEHPVPFPWLTSIHCCFAFEIVLWTWTGMIVFDSYWPQRRTWYRCICNSVVWTLSLTDKKYFMLICRIVWCKNMLDVHYSTIDSMTRPICLVKRRHELNFNISLNKINKIARDKCICFAYSILVQK